mmetsp:Transcript_56360/g.150724  ORF Transcript_56360/g.150724 Transcript_56360/m.150724 type:complete len:221 (+) Transcript_56360:421-1083(+)
MRRWETSEGFLPGVRVTSVRGLSSDAQPDVVLSTLVHVLEANLGLHGCAFTAGSRTVPGTPSVAARRTLAPALTTSSATTSSMKELAEDTAAAAVLPTTTAVLLTAAAAVNVADLADSKATESRRESRTPCTESVRFCPNSLAADLAESRETDSLSDSRTFWTDGKVKVGHRIGSSGVHASTRIAPSTSGHSTRARKGVEMVSTSSVIASTTRPSDNSRG